MEINHLPLMAEYADILQVGARNMQNFNLLKALGSQPRPVLLKRGLAATLEESPALRRVHHVWRQLQRHTV